MKKYFKRKKWCFILVAGLIVINSAFSTLAGISSANALSEIAQKNGKQFFIWVLTMAAAYVVYAIVGYFVTISKTHLKQDIDTLVRADIAKRMEHSNYQAFHEQKVATYTSWMTNDVNTINDFGIDNLMMIIQQVSEILFGAVTLAYFHVSLLVTVIILTAIMTIVPNLFSKWMSKRSLEFTHANERLVNRINDILEGFSVLFLGNNLYLITKKINQASADVKDKTVNYAKAAGLTQAVTNGIAFLSQVIVLMQTGWLILHGLTPVGTVSGAQYFAGTIFAELSGISFNWQEFKTIRPILAKFKTIKIQKEEKSDSKITKPEITVSDLSYTYPGSKRKVLKQVNVKFESGKKYIIVGDSASGKTTLFNMISGLIRDYQGNIFLDDFNYNDVSDKQLHESVAYVEQTPYIFDASLRWNLTLGNKVEKDKLTELVKQTGLSALVKELPDGLDSKLDIHKLSGGQKQRISFARALLREKPIYLLDEFTSSLDKEASLDLEKLMMSKKNTTVVMITHHLEEETKESADRVINISEL